MENSPPRSLSPKRTQQPSQIDRAVCDALSCVRCSFARLDGSARCEREGEGEGERERETSFPRVVFGQSHPVDPTDGADGWGRVPAMGGVIEEGNHQPMVRR